MRFVVRLSVLVVMSATGGAFSASAQTPAAPGSLPRPGGVVIRERVEVTPAPPTVASRDDECTGGTVAYVVYDGNIYMPRTVGAPLTGALDVTGPCGDASASLAPGFQLLSVDDPYYYYAPAGEILRYPLSPTAPLPAATVTVADSTLPATASIRYRCRPWPICQTTSTLDQADFGIRGRVDGYATGQQHAWPDSVACGTTTPLPVTLTKAGGAEGYVGPLGGLGYQILGWSGPAQGALQYDGAVGGDFVVPYGDVRTGAVTFVAPACETMRAPMDGYVHVDGLPYGYAFDDQIHVEPPPPVALRVTAAPDTLASGEMATVVSVAVSSEDTETYLDPETAVTLTASPSALGYFYYRPWGGSNVYGPTVTVQYREPGPGARRGVNYHSQASSQPVCDTPVTVTASGGGLSGSTEILILGTSTAGPDTLVVTVSPGTLAPGDSAVVSVAARSVDGCDVGGAIPDSTLLSVALSSAAEGSLEYEGERAAVFLSVPYGDLKSGRVRFVADGTGPTCSSPVRVAVFGEGMWGEAEIVVQSSEDRSRADDPAAAPRDDGPICGTEPDWAAILLGQLLAEDPFALLDVPCDQLPRWISLNRHRVPEAVMDRLNSLAVLSPYEIRYMQDGSGAVANLDYFAVTVPIANLPATYSLDTYLEHVRMGINDHTEGSLFEAYPGIPNEWVRWLENPLGSLLSIQLFGETPPRTWGDDGSVVTSAYSQTGWTFTTVHTPADDWHPVNGNRAFGYVDNNDGTATFYTRGVDRFSVFGYQYVQATTGIPFSRADALWESFQALIAAEVPNAFVHPPVRYRPRYSAVRDVLDGRAPLSTLGCRQP